jgi:DNA-binding MarR family transcriptional regulator
VTFIDLDGELIVPPRELGITQGGLRALLAIDPEDPRPMRELARVLNCDASYVTGLVDDLERAGYAVRRPAATDRRVKTVALTAAGKRALRKAERSLMAPPEQLTALPPEAQRGLARALAGALSPATEGS